MSTTSQEQPAIVVAGDIVVDHHIYEGVRNSPTGGSRPGVREVQQLGGACLIQQLLEQLHAGGEAYRVALGTKPPDDRAGGHHSYAVWTPYARESGSSERVWRARLVMGYGDDGERGRSDGRRAGSSPRYAPTPVAAPPRPRVLVLDDAGILFRHREHRKAWLMPAARTPQPDWILLKTAAPIAQGDLWHALVPDFRDRLICVVAADDLRQERVKLGAGLSWERTVEDLRDGLQRNAALAPLLSCRGLIVTLSIDGAFWLDQSDPANPVATLVCDAAAAEAELMRATQGSSFGYLSCIVAALTHGMARYEPAAAEASSLSRAVVPAIGTGLAAMRDLLRDGHGSAGEPADGFPAARLAQIIGVPQTPASRGRAAPVTKFAEVRIPWQHSAPVPTADASPWMIVEMTQRPLASTHHPSLLGLARQLVLQGTRVLERIPHARFGKLVTADRTEFESLRAIQRAMLDYRENDRPRRPLSIGVFGPPGSGKSFGVKQIATSIHGDDAWLEFNLSQFSGVADLNGAFHQVRDLVLSGLTPVVFWDEFDAREYEWLQYLLAPMQDGRFQEGQLTHAIGKCVMIFAGGTSYSFAEFGPRADAADAVRRFTLRKGPDFVSRLDERYDVLGPDQRTLPSPDGAPRRVPDPTDVCHPLRRAILIRALLGVAERDRLDIDSDLLDALLQVPSYRHGVRSLEKLVAALSANGTRTLSRSALPPPPALDRYVDAEAFLEILDRNTSFRAAAVIEPLAKAIHHTWRALSKRHGYPMRPHLDRPYDQLAAVDQEDNRAAARRMPDNLALVGLSLVRSETGVVSDADGDHALIREHLEHHLERLAEAEHDGWVEHRERNGWRFGKSRSDSTKLHPALVPYAQLAESDREKDRDSIRHYSEFAAEAGYEIRFIKA